LPGIYKDFNFGKMLVLKQAFESHGEHFLIVNDQDFGLKDACAEIHKFL
jgi:hypothetical protein